MAQRKSEKTENEPISIEKMTFKKTTRSKRYGNYYGFVKSRVAARVAARASKNDDFLASHLNVKNVGTSRTWEAHVAILDQ